MAKDITTSGAHASQDSSATDDAGKGKSLSERLAEFEAGTKAKAAASTDSSASELSALKAEVERLRTAEADRTYRREMDEKLIPAIRGDMDVHPKHVERWLNEQAASDSKLMKAWENREDDPDTFAAVIEALKPKFAAAAADEGLVGTARKPDRKLGAAIRGARETHTGALDGSNANVANMSDQEFAMHKAEVFRQASAGQL